MRVTCHASMGGTRKRDSVAGKRELVRRPVQDEVNLDRSNFMGDAVMTQSPLNLTIVLTNS